MNTAFCVCCLLLTQTGDASRQTFAPPADAFQRRVAPATPLSDDKSAAADLMSKAPAKDAPLATPWRNTPAEVNSGGISLAPTQTPSRTQPADQAAPKTFSSQASVSPLTPAKSAVASPAASDTAAPSSPASDLMSEALLSVKEDALQGRAMTLLQSLTRTSDRANQLRITRAYWRLSCAIADYHWTIEERSRLDRLDGKPGTPDASIVKSAVASASARVKEAEVAAVTAQNEVAEAINLAAGEPLPVPSDAPYIGPYRTYFDKIFATRTPTSRARLIDRSLPVRRDAIDARTQAVQAAADAAQSALDAYRRGQLDIHSALACQAQLRRERQAFLNAVRDYNYDIAEYALAATEGSVNETTLVSMLIRTKARPNATSAVPREPTPAVAREPRGPQASLDETPPEWRGVHPTTTDTVGDEDSAVRPASFEEDAEPKPVKVPFSVMVQPPR